MNIKRVNPLAKGSAPNSKTVAGGAPRLVHRVGDTIVFTVNDIDTSKAHIWRVQLLQAELELLVEKFNMGASA